MGRLYRMHSEDDWKSLKKYTSCTQALRKQAFISKLIAVTSWLDAVVAYYALWCLLEANCTFYKWVAIKDLSFVVNMV